jgi:hypothetical protein
MKYLLFLIPSIAFANWISGPESPAYANQTVCEQREDTRCYFVPPDKREFRGVGRIEDIEVDDPTKPIHEFTEPEEWCPEELEAKEPIEQECRMVCPEHYEHIRDEENELINCRKTVGYEQKIIQEFRIPEAARQALIQERAQQAQAEQARRNQCEQFRSLLNDSAIDSRSTPEDVKEVTRRLLGFYQHCR